MYIYIYKFTFQYQQNDEHLSKWWNWVRIETYDQFLGFLQAQLKWRTNVRFLNDFSNVSAYDHYTGHVYIVRHDHQLNCFGSLSKILLKHFSYVKKKSFRIISESFLFHFICVHGFKGQLQKMQCVVGNPSSVWMYKGKRRENVWSLAQWGNILVPYGHPVQDNARTPTHAVIFLCCCCTNGCCSPSQN